MIDRVSFIAGAACSAVVLPIVTRADEPSAEPSPSPAPKPAPSGKPHVHGNNGVTMIPERRLVEWKLEVLDGPRFKLSDYRGVVVFCNVFATWCGPCREEQPDLVAFARAHITTPRSSASTSGKKTTTSAHIAR